MLQCGALWCESKLFAACCVSLGRHLDKQQEPRHAALHVEVQEHHLASLQSVKVDGVGQQAEHFCSLCRLTAQRDQGHGRKDVLAPPQT